MLFYNLFGDRQAQTCSLTSLRAKEDIKDPLADILGYTCAVVINRDKNFALPLFLCTDLYLTIFLVQSVDCIGKQVE